MTYQPTGSMCCSCVNRGPCSHLDFATMPPLKSYDDGTVAVRCTSHTKGR